MHAQGESMETMAVHGGERRPGPEGSVVYPIYQGTVYSVEPGTDYHDIPYIRLNSTPSQRYLHDKLAALEGAQAAVATSSGMAAMTTTAAAWTRTPGSCLPAASRHSPCGSARRTKTPPRWPASSPAIRRSPLSTTPGSPPTPTMSTPQGCYPGSAAC
jgi:Cys/Met metabolism PLP-dependent enzyme